MEDNKPVERKIRPEEPVRLPANWEDSLSRPADLADKIRAVNNGERNVPPALLDRLRREEHNTGKRKVKGGSSSSPLVLSHNWYNSSSQELARKIKAKLSKTSTGSKKFSELLSRLERKRSQNEMKSAKAGPIKLPADWANSSSRELLEKISSCQNVDQVCLSKIQANMTRPRVVEANQSHSSAVILPSNWASSPEDLRKALEGRKSNNQEIGKVLQNLKKNKDPKLAARISKKRSRCRAGRASRSKVLSKSNAGPVFKLPADWSTCNFSELAAKISSSKIGQNSLGLEKIVANLKSSGNLVRQDPPSGQSTPVRLPANWSNCSPRMLADNIKKQNLNPQILSRLLAKLQRVQLPDKEYRNSGDKRSKFKKSKTSKRHDRASDPKPSPVKLPANWEDASRQQLAESLNMQNLDASVKSTLLANLARTKQPNMESRGLRKHKSSDKHGRHRFGHSNTARREVNTKKPIQLPSDWKSICPDILAQVLRAEQSTKEGLGKVIENLKTQKRNSENPKEEGIKKRKVVHQKQTKHVYKKMREEMSQMDKKRRNDEKKKSNEFSTVLNISEEEKTRLLEPAQFGWRRECAVGVTGARLTPVGALVKEKIRIDIYYWSPSPISKRVDLPANLNRKDLNIEMKKLGAKRIKNTQEMKAFLENTNIERKTGITMENFSFKAKILDLGDFEYVRYTELARLHLAERERVKQAKNDKGWIVESLEDVNNEMSEVTQRPEDSFGDISDLEDDLEVMEEGKSEEPPRKTEEKLFSKKIKELSICAEVDQKGSLKLNDDIKEGDLQSVELQQDLSGLKDIESTCKRSQDGNTDDQKSKVQKKDKERITLVVESFDLQLTLSLSVKPKRPVSQALNTFCTKYKLEMEDLQFWCGERRLGGEEKNSSLEERIISVSLAPTKRKSPV